MADADKIWFLIVNGWRHLLEIFILAVLIYFVFKFVRGTRGWPVVIGFVVVLLTLFLVTTILDLKVLRWMLGSASVFIAFGALVIFQPELRRMLGGARQPAALCQRERAARKPSRSSSRLSSGWRT